MKRLKELLNANPGYLIEAHGNGHSLYFAYVKHKKIKISHALFSYVKRAGLIPIENRHINLIK